MKKLLVFLLLLGPAWCLHAQEAGAVAAEQARIKAERAQAEQIFLAEEKACYGKFAVNDCINAARAKRREVVANLRRRELLISDTERKRKAAERLRDIEERRADAQRDQPAQRTKALAEQRDREARAAAKAAERAAREGREPPAAPEKSAKVADQAQKDSQTARNRKQHEHRLAQAQERKAKYEKRLAERKKPAAPPLPVPR